MVQTGGSVLVLKNLKKFYRDMDILIDAEFPHGINAIVGPSGSGKTTTLNCIAGLVRPDGGEITVEGKTLFRGQSRVDLPPYDRRIGYVFQESLLFPHLNVEENLMFGFKLLPKTERKIDLDRLIRLLQLEPLLSRSPNALSGGERQRVALGRSLATSPRLLLLDEPLASVGLLLRGQIIRYLREVWSSLGVSIIYVSHSISEVLALCNETYVLVGGRLIASGPSAQILSQPKVAESIGITGLENFPTVRILRHDENEELSEAQLGRARLVFPIAKHIPIGREVMVCIRARDIVLTKEIPNAISARNILRAKVDRIQDLGAKSLVHVDMEEQLVAEISQSARAELAIEKGQDIFVVIKSNSVSVMDE